MHSSLVRAQNVFGFFTTMAFVVAAAIAVSDIFSPRETFANVKLRDVEVVRGRHNYHSAAIQEFATLHFDLSANLSSLFTWNTKQVYVYVTAYWYIPDPSIPPQNMTLAEAAKHMIRQEAVIWDTIINSPSSEYLTKDYEKKKRKKERIAEKKRKAIAAGKKVPEDEPVEALGNLFHRNLKSDYPITSPSGKMANLKGARLQIAYNVQPWVGFLTWRPNSDFWRWKTMKKNVAKPFNFPAVKLSKKEYERMVNDGRGEEVEALKKLERDRRRAEEEDLKQQLEEDKRRRAAGMQCEVGEEEQDVEDL